jgi:hypothetical protein
MTFLSPSVSELYRSFSLAIEQDCFANRCHQQQLGGVVATRGVLCVITQRLSLKNEMGNCFIKFVLLCEISEI